MDWWIYICFVVVYIISFGVSRLHFMKRKYKIILVLSIIAITCAFFYYKNFCDYYESGETDTFNLNVGETFEIKLYENGSTGYVNCWLNESESRIVKRVNEDYVPGINARLGAIGSGGIVTITFKAISTGRQTIKIANCPVGPEQKKCAEYTDKTTETEYEFMVEVKE